MNEKTAASANPLGRRELTYMLFLKTYIFTLIPFIILDALWLGFIAPGFYKKHIGFLLAKNPDWIAAAVFYLIFVTGIVIFVTYQEQSISRAAIRGALFGLVCYATYDLTNQATVEGWPIIVTMVDLCWGAIICCATASASVILSKMV
jgi:uncharacterized membrane protein